MSRIPRKRLGRGVYHIINRGLDQRWIFEREDDRRKFVEILCGLRKFYQLNIYHWAVMSNHFHMAIESLTPEALSNYIGKACERYTKYYHRRYGGCGTMWQGRYRSIIVQKEGYLGRLGRYIERNPVRAEIVKCPWHYKWSSAAAYSGLNEKDPLVVLSDHPFRNSMADTEPLRCKSYMKYLLSEKEISDDMEVFSSSRKLIFIGDDSFRSSLLQSKGRTSARKKGKPSKA